MFSFSAESMLHLAEDLCFTGMNAVTFLCYKQGCIDPTVLRHAFSLRNIQSMGGQRTLETTTDGNSQNTCEGLTRLYQLAEGTSAQGMN